VVAVRMLGMLLLVAFGDRADDTGCVPST